MSLLKRIDEDLKVALKARDHAKVSPLRMLKAAMNNLALQRKKQSLEEGEVLEVIEKLIKRHEESVEAFTKGGRQDLSQKEAKEAQILRAYLPPAMEEGELKGLIEAAIQELGLTAPLELGQVMKAVLPKVKGRADGKRVSDLVNQILKGRGLTPGGAG